MRSLSTVLAVAVLMTLGARLAAEEAKADRGPAERIQDLNLTDEQEAKIADIRKEYRPKVQEAGNKLRAAVKEEVERIVAVIKG